jgi:hypothetical protein
MRHILITIGFCTAAWWVIGLIERWQSYSKIWELNKREPIHEHMEKENDRD